MERKIWNLKKKEETAQWPNWLRVESVAKRTEKERKKKMCATKSSCFFLSLFLLSDQFSYFLIFHQKDKLRRERWQSTQFYWIVNLLEPNLPLVNFGMFFSLASFFLSLFLSFAAQIKFCLCMFLCLNSIYFHKRLVRQTCIAYAYADWHTLKKKSQTTLI